MIVHTLFSVGCIMFFYGVFRLHRAEGFDFYAFVPILLSIGIVGSALFVVVATWFGATL